MLHPRNMMLILFLSGFVLVGQCDGFPDCLDKSDEVDEVDECGAECVLNDLKKFLDKDEPVKAVYRSGDTIRISCLKDYEYGDAYEYLEETSTEVTCNNGRWVGYIPKCISNADSSIVSTPEADSDVVTSTNDVDVAHYGSTNHARSESGNSRADDIKPQTDIGFMTTTEGLNAGKADCQLHGFRQYLNDNDPTKISYRHGHKISIACLQGDADDPSNDTQQISSDSGSELTCHDGQWIGYYPECFKSCLPNVLKDFIVDEQNIMEEYRSGELISVSCSGNSTDLTRNLTCLNGQWIGEYPECFERCRRSRVQGNLMMETGSEYFLPGDVVQIQICWGNTPVEGDGHLTCMANGVWYGNATCPPLSDSDCLPPPDVQNAYISGRRWDRYPEGSNVTYKCEKDFWLRGKNKLTCINGKWTEHQFYCITRTCFYPGEIENGQILNITVEVGQYVHFSCDDGYILKGPHLLVCNADGNFYSEMKPACEAVQCQPLTPPEHGWIDHYEDHNGRTSNDYGSYVRIRCEQGYQLIGNERRQCQADKTWSGEGAICQKTRANCYRIPEVPGATIDGKRRLWYAHGSNISYNCVENYIRTGNNQFACVDGHWLGGDLNCTTECVLNDLKQFLDKDEPVKAVYRRGDKIRIFCPIDDDYGYAYNDEETSAELSCNNGSWVGYVPQCISNEDSNIKSTPKADLDAVIKSTPKADLDAVIKSTPKADLGAVTGEVDATQHVMAAKCQLDGFSQYLMKNKLTEKSYGHGQKINITCPHSDDHDYDYGQLSDDSHSELTCHDGQWIGSYPECFKGCIPNVLKDFLMEEQDTMDEYRSGEIISVSCSRNSSESKVGKNILDYEFDDQTLADQTRNLTCLNGQWVGEYPECFALCRRSSVQGNLMMETGSEYFLPGDVVQIKICWGNIQVEGDGHLTCMANGSWYGNATCPSQSVLDCLTPRGIQNAYISGNHWDRYPVGSVITYKCSHSHWLRGNNKVTCINGKWTEEQFYCEIRTCQYPGDIENGQILNKSVQVGQYIHFRCDDGYILKGPNMMLCYADGNFRSEIMPTCEAVQCQPLTPPEHGWIDHYEYFNGRTRNDYGSFVRIRCEQGYKLIGNERRQCQANKTWSGEDAICQRQRANCYIIPQVPGAKLEGQERPWYIHGSNISYSCVENYILRGNRQFSCVDGHWMGGGLNCTRPVCELSLLDLRYGRFHGVNQMTIVHGDSVSIREAIKCNHGYTVPPNISYVSCYNGTIDPPKFDCIKYADSIRSCHLSKNVGKVIRYGDKCYLVTHSTFMYRNNDAETFCQNLGSNASLAIVPDKETNDAIRYLMNMVPGENKYWFGAMWSKHSSRWEWRNGKPFNYTNWKSGEGSKTANVKLQYCAVLTSDGRWEDTFCWNIGFTENKYKAICEIAVTW